MFTQFLILKMFTQAGEIKPLLNYKLRLEVLIFTCLERFPSLIVRPEGEYSEKTIWSFRIEN
jgi:hypothetical protein